MIEYSRNPAVTFSGDAFFAQVIHPAMVNKIQNNPIRPLHKYRNAVTVTITQILRNSRESKIA